VTDARHRLASYALVLAGVFGSAYALGEALPGHSHGDGGGHDGGHGGEHGGHAAGSTPGGSGVAAGAATLGLSSTVGADRLVIVDHGPDHLSLRVERGGAPITDVDEAHGADLHLLLVRRDLAGFQHVHPTLGPDGTWTARDVALAAGAWRVVAELQPAGDSGPLVLGIDLLVPGDVVVEPLPGPASEVAVDGVAVSLSAGEGELRFDASPAEGIGPYLGQPAHVVAFREGDLAYVHLHPASDAPGRYRVAAGLPGTGTYRVFLQFTRDGQVVTVPFTLHTVEGVPRGAGS